MSDNSAQLKWFNGWKYVLLVLFDDWQGHNRNKQPNSFGGNACPHYFRFADGVTVRSPASSMPAGCNCTLISTPNGYICIFLNIPCTKPRWVFGSCLPVNLTFWCHLRLPFNGLKRATASLHRFHPTPTIPGSTCRNKHLECLDAILWVVPQTNIKPSLNLLCCRIQAFSEPSKSSSATSFRAYQPNVA
jgi:hypothetical protein